LNFLRPQLASAPQAFGMGGGGGSNETFAAQAPAAEAPAATQAPAATEAPAPVIEMAPLATMTTSAAEDAARALETETAVQKNGATANGLGGAPAQEPPQAPSEAPVVSSVWQWLLAGIALLSAFIMALMRQLSINRWRR